MLVFLRPGKFVYSRFNPLKEKWKSTRIETSKRKSKKKMRNEKKDRWGTDYRRIIGFAGGDRAASHPTIIEATDLNPFLLLLCLIQIGSLRLIRRSAWRRLRILVIARDDRSGQALYLWAPRVVRPRQPCMVSRAIPNQG